MKQNVGASLLLAALLSLLMFPVFGADGGTIGEALTWTFENETLTITGSGEMPDYSAEPAPWAELTDVKMLVVEAGVTTVGAKAFSALDALQSVSLPASLTAIGESAFSSSALVTEVRYGGTHAQWHALTLSNEAAAPLILAAVECKTETGETVVLTAEDLPETESTCTIAGTTGGKRCSECGTVLLAPTAKEPKGHVWSLKITPATRKRDGKRTYTCENCGIKVGKPIAQIASVSLSETEIAKDGKKHTPAVTVRDMNGKKLKKGRDFTVSYDPGRKAFGTYDVAVTFRGNYAGGKLLHFTIGLAAPQNLQRSNVGATIATLSWDRVKYATSYLLYYAPEKAGPYKRFAEASGCSYNISNLQPKTGYYFKVKAIRRESDRLITGPASAARGLNTHALQITSSGRVLVEITQENRLLAVVNHSREIPQSYQPKLKELSERGKYLDYEAAEAFETMRAAAKREGITLYAYSPYRSYSHQKASLESIIRDRQSQGYSRSRAEELALQVSLPPGTSEHNLGLAVDIHSTAQTFKNTRAYAWLQKNGQNYGFILRYPDGKQDVTGISFEPWHWRYVGVENAKKIKKSGLTLEEYTATLKAPY